MALFLILTTFLSLIFHHIAALPLSKEPRGTRYIKDSMTVLA